MKHRVGPALIALAFMIGACAPAASPATVSAPSAQPTAEVGTRPGFAAPGFTLKTLDGGEVGLSDYAGRPVFINFWASWCGPCRAEMPEIVAAYQAHKDTGLEVLAINLTFQDAVGDAQAFVDEFQMPFPILLDEQSNVSKAYELLGLPTSVFIDAGGIIRIVHSGPMTRDLIEQYLAEILPAR